MSGVASHEADDKKPQGPHAGEPGGFLAPFAVTVDPALLAQALTHRSWAFEHGGAPHNERLEFLGDAVLGQAVTAKLFREFPDLSEGDLARRRATIVSSAALAEIARRIDLGAHIKLGKGERKTGGRGKDSILADTVEAVIGAVFLSAGPAVADRFVLDLTEPFFTDIERHAAMLDPKTRLQEEAAARGEPFPSYQVEATGPNHDRVYTATTELDGFIGTGSGTNKKAAELAAARDVVQQLAEHDRLRTNRPTPQTTRQGRAGA